MYTEPTPLDAWPDVPVIDVRSEGDLLVSPRWAAEAVPRRLGVASVVLRDAGHSSPISHAPELAEILIAATRDSPDRSAPAV